LRKGLLGPYTIPPLEKKGRKILFPRCKEKKIRGLACLSGKRKEVMVVPDGKRKTGQERRKERAEFVFVIV